MLAHASLWVTPPEAVWKWVHRLGGPGLILLGIADNTPFVSAPPRSVDILVILLSVHHYQWWAYYAFMATVGEVLGGYITYRLAHKGGQETLEKKIGKARVEKLYNVFGKYGMHTILWGALLPPPFPFTSVLMAAGVMQFPRKRFFSALLTGRAVRFFAIAFLSRTYGQQIIRFVSHYYYPMTYVLIGLAVTASLGATIYFRSRGRKIQRDKAGRTSKFKSASETGQMKTEMTDK